MGNQSCSSTPISAAAQLAATQAEDAELQQLVQHNTKFKQISRGGQQAVWCKMSHSRPRLAVPVKLKPLIFQELHSLGHAGVKATTRLVRECYFWPDMAKQVRQWMHECVHCQCSKVVRHTQPPTQQILMPSSRFEHIHVDIIGLLPSSQGFTHLFTIVDRYLRWPKVIPIADTLASSLCMALLYG